MGVWQSGSQYQPWKAGTGADVRNRGRLDKLTNPQARQAVGDVGIDRLDRIGDRCRSGPLASEGGEQCGQALDGWTRQIMAGRLRRQTLGGPMRKPVSLRQRENRFA